jgi:diaminopimelate epimerase
MLISYAKYQALGNSFIVLDHIYRRGRLKRFRNLARAICNTGTGIGADGLLVISKLHNTHRADIYNADGSWAEKSGNGVRIAAMHLKNRHYVSGRHCRLQTGSGYSDIILYAGSEKRRSISGSLGRPVFDARRIPVDTSEKFFLNQPITCGGTRYHISAVSIGNPHLIIFCDDFDFDWQAVGRMLEVERAFPKRINVGFVRVLTTKRIEVRDWERGVGPTQSSGTGAAAAVAVCVASKQTGRAVDVKSPAGILAVHWDVHSDQISIKGPVAYIGEGVYAWNARAKD